jgi:hypothetical protein
LEASRTGGGSLPLTVSFPLPILVNFTARRFFPGGDPSQAANRLVPSSGFSPVGFSFDDTARAVLSGGLVSFPAVKPTPESIFFDVHLNGYIPSPAALVSSFKVSLWNPLNVFVSAIDCRIQYVTVTWLVCNPLSSEQLAALKIAISANFTNLPFALWDATSLVVAPAFHTVYSYAVVPSLFGITGCDAGPAIDADTTQAVLTVNCPTNGNAVITVSGANLVAPLTLTLGGVLIKTAITLSAGNTLASFALPASAGGQDLTLAVSSSANDAQLRHALSYAPPVILNMTGCANGNTASLFLTGCARFGGQAVAFWGTNFGSSGARYLPFVLSF